MYIECGCEKMEVFYRETYAEINLQAITYNISEMKKRLPEHVEVFAAVKANAYGHGDIECAKAALEAGVTCLLVAYLDEAISLRRAGIEAPILVLGVTHAGHAPIAAKYNISLTAFNLEWMQAVEKSLTNNQSICVHIKCDTGMGRIGLKEIAELKQMEEHLTHSKKIKFSGIYTHFATADQQDEEYYQQQLTRFKQMVEQLNILPPYIHAANSAATLIHNDSFFTAVRVGIAMYGLTPSTEINKQLPFQLKQAFSLHSEITHIKQVSPGEKIGYGATYTAKTNEWIATIPIGYGDGWMRKLSGQEIIVAQQRMPIVGRICMDQMMVRLGDYQPVGTKVTLIGRQGNEAITVDEIAEKLETINYEVTCLVSKRVPRVYM